MAVGLGDGDGAEVETEMVELALVPAERVDSTTQAQRTHGRTGRGTMVVLGFLLLFTHCTL